MISRNVAPNSLPRLHAMGALLTDFHQLTLLQASLQESLEGLAVFEMFVRRLPPGRRRPSGA